MCVAHDAINYKVSHFDSPFAKLSLSAIIRYATVHFHACQNESLGQTSSMDMIKIVRQGIKSPQ
jgi:hypothetical protein